MDVFHEQQGHAFVVMKDKPIDLFIEDNHDRELPIVGMLQQPAVIGSTIIPKIIAEALTLQTGDLLSGKLTPSVVKTEVSHLMVPLKNLEVLNNAIPDKILLNKIAQQYGFQGAYCFALTEDDAENIAQTRFFNPGIGIDEDAATGSAAGPLAGLLYEKQLIKKNIEYQLLQGVKMKQSSTIKFKVENNGIVISGSSVMTMEGNIYI